ncbi:hypothetical protein Aple_086460 [Acrocarpospora pleiomorpha]|uniref:Uncharacterized protein n=1 Tax=Acrocarpospora pleiomorpha TaxID=90975 RepID=A0A5M3XX78_9ACTN|nr:hypothetical protein Aple_086460 [Acrocarpospora pleiomorpha]
MFGALDAIQVRRVTSAWCVGDLHWHNRPSATQRDTVHIPGPDAAGQDLGDPVSPSSVIAPITGGQASSRPTGCR